MNQIQKIKQNIKLGLSQYDIVAEKYKPFWLKSIEKHYNPYINFFAAVNLLNLVFIGFLKNYSLIIFFFFLVYFCWYNFMLSYYLLPHWKEMIVKNSPTNTIASIVALVKTSKAPIIVACLACGSLVYGIDLAHERLWPDKKPPLQVAGEQITKYTGYPPKDWTK